MKSIKTGKRLDQSNRPTKFHLRTAHAYIIMVDDEITKNIDCETPTRLNIGRFFYHRSRHYDMPPIA